MKVMINDEVLFELSDLKKRVICNDILSEVIEDDLKRRIAYIIGHKYERCMDRLKKEWVPKLKAAGVESIPLNDDAFARMVFARPDYKDRSTREKEARPAEFSKDIVAIKATVKNQLAGEVSKI